MNIAIPPETDTHGVIRVGGTRVTLDSVIYAFQQGATPEEIVSKFPTLHLADVYATISYYLQNQDEVDEYLRQQEAEAQQIREELNVQFDLVGIRERLLARKAATERGNDA
jgi:uncharacterized protein (DUF433 family)